MSQTSSQKGYDWAKNKLKLATKRPFEDNAFAGRPDLPRDF
jgi:hypothetical protein